MTSSSSCDHVAIGAYLAERAKLPRDEAPVFYGELADRFGLPPVDNHWASHPLCRIFDIIDHEDAAANRPFRTALVVSRDRGIPGPGFFDTLRQLRGPKRLPKDESEQRRVWLAEFDRLIAHSWPNRSV